MIWRADKLFNELNKMYREVLDAGVTDWSVITIARKHDIHPITFRNYLKETSRFFSTKVNATYGDKTYKIQKIDDRYVWIRKKKLYKISKPEFLQKWL